MHIKNSFNVPRGVLETACEWNYEETVAQLVESRDKEIVVVDIGVPGAGFVTCPHSRYHSLSHTFQLPALGVRTPERRQIQERRIGPNGLRRWRSIAQ